MGGAGENPQRNATAEPTEETPDDGVEVTAKGSDTDEGPDIERTGLLSRLTLSWITSLVRAGYRKKQLETSDLWRLRRVDEPAMLAEQFVEALDRYRYQLPDGSSGFAPYALFRAAFRVHFWDFILSGVLELSFAALRFAGPVLLRRLVLALESGNSGEGYAFAAGLFAAQLLSTLCQSHSRFVGVQIGLRVKNALSLATFEQVLALDQEGRQAMSDGQVVNLLSTDAEVAVEFMRMWNRFWTAPIVLVGGIAYIYVYVGPSVFFGVLLMAGFVPISVKFGKVQTRMQRRKMVQTDVRVKTVNEMMQGIKVLKSNAWEEPLLGMLDAVRNVEMRAIRRLHFYRGVMLPFAIAIPNVASVATFGAYILLGNKVTPADTFAVVSAFVVIRSPFVTLPLAITMVTRALVSAQRFTSFFALKTLSEPGVADPGQQRSVPNGAMCEEVGREVDKTDGAAVRGAHAIQVRDASFSWSAMRTSNGDIKTESPNDTGTVGVSDDTQVEKLGKGGFRLQGLDFTVKQGELVAVIGQIGDGKSSLISALLGEMTRVCGRVNVCGSVALCVQESFIMNRTVRENILFESLFDSQRYNATLETCALVSDLAVFPASDLTEIGERGINVSGGQKARISLARAVFSQSDIYLLDDPLSAVDAHVGKHIFTHCISNNEGSALRGTTRIFVTNQLHLLDQMDRILLMKDGRIAEQGTLDEIMARCGGLIRALQEKHKLSNGEELDADSIPDVDVGVSNNAEGEFRSAAKGAGSMGRTPISERDDEMEGRAKTKGALIREEGREEGGLRWSVIATYWLAGTGGSTILALLILSTFFITEALFLSIDSWLAMYSQQDPDDPELSESTFLFVYFGVTAGFFFVMMTRTLKYAAFSVAACRRLYANLQSNVFYLPMRFFWATPLGRILNRLSKDTSDVDTMLPEQMQWLIMTGARVIGVLCIISITVPFFLVAVVPFIILYWAIREYYRRTAVNVQRLESILRSPVYSHLGETLQGASTIKAFNRTKEWLRVATTLIGLNHRAFLAVEATQVWLSMRLEALGALIILVTATAITATEAEPGLAGLALAYALNLVINLQMTVQMSSQVEARMNAVERMIDYSSLPNERALNDVDPPSEAWPSAGAIRLEGVSLKYREDLDPALNGVDLDIPAGTRVAIVGKTGSGKSTIVAALLRLVPISDGRLFIDDVDTAGVPLHALRSVLTCIPQDPVLFTSSVRKNLDPFDDHSDEEVWDAIDKAHLRKTVDALPSGLFSGIAQGGENLSVGERQLVCIARAILRRSKIVVLDEASASLDRETDALIQKSIRTCFPGCTMLVVAHRLETVLDLDRAIVMDEGRVAEYDSIPSLLKRPDGKLRGLLKAASSSR